MTRCNLRLPSMTTKRIREPNPKRKNSCSKLDIPRFLRTVENTRIKLNPTAAKTTQAKLRFTYKTSKEIHDFSFAFYLFCRIFI